MCLITDDKICHTASRDIPCLKIIDTSITRNKIYTPYQYYPLCNSIKELHGLVLKADYLDTPKCKFESNDFRIKEITREQGPFEIHHGIHSYNISFPSFKLSTGLGEGYLVVDAFIPKGTRFYKNEGEYCSEQIIFK